MNLKSISASVCLTTGALLFFSASAHAITFTIGGTAPSANGSFSTVSGANTINFNDLPTSNTSATYTSGIATFSQGSRLLVRNSSQTVGATTQNPTGGYAPGDGTTKDTSNYLITGGYYDEKNTNFSATNPNGISTSHPLINIDFSTGTNYFGLYWGLINETNQIQFYSGLNGGGTLLNTTTVNPTTGQQAGTAVTGNELGIAGVTPGASGPSGYVNFFTASNETIRSVRLSNTTGGNGFEFDNVAVPWTPSPILDLLGLASLGVVIGLKRKLRNKPKLFSKLILKSKLN